jgi:hypothetical protein
MSILTRGQANDHALGFVVGIDQEVLMGAFNYDSTLKVEFDDRVLAHMQIVIGAKLRRGESFYFSWRDDDSVGDGRTTVWLHPALPLVYKYYGGRMPRINPAWIQVLTDSANSNGGLQLLPEPEAEPTAGPLA